MLGQVESPRRSQGLPKPGEQEYFLDLQADVMLFHGELNNARELIRRAVEIARHSDLNQDAADYQVGLEWSEAELGNFETARKQVGAALAMSTDRDLQVQAAVVLARAGDGMQAQKIADDLAKRFPSDTLINFIWLPSIRAAIEIDRKNPAKAVEYLQTTLPYDLSFLVELYPTFLRGVAYLQLQRGAEAEFQKLFLHRGLVGYSQQGALAHLGIARAYVLQGQKPKARAAYNDFLTLWKEADPDIPILKQAKAEYAKLQ